MPKTQKFFQIFLSIALALNLLGGVFFDTVPTSYLIRNRMFVKSPPSADDAVDDGINKPSEEVLVAPSAVDDQIALIERSGLQRKTKDILSVNPGIHNINKKTLDTLLDIEDDFIRMHEKFGNAFVQLGVDDVDDYVRFVAENEERIAKSINDYRLNPNVFFEVTTYNRNLTFAPDDMVYGLANGGKLRATQQLGGGKLLTDFSNPDGKLIQEYTKEIIDQTVKNGNIIHFDLTSMDDMVGVLNGSGLYANNITSIELRYIRDNWEVLKDGVRFYMNGIEVIAPWL